MRNPKNGGLSGKARHARNRSRAGRLSSRQMIFDYLDPDDWTSSDQAQPIRIGQRSEFLPSIGSSGTFAPTGQQATKPAIYGAPASSTEGAQPIRLARTPQADTVGQAFQPVMDRLQSRSHKPARSFNLGGFLYGCLVGGAAAAVLLLLVHLAVG